MGSPAGHALQLAVKTRSGDWTDDKNKPGTNRRQKAAVLPIVTLAGGWGSQANSTYKHTKHRFVE